MYSLLLVAYNSTYNATYFIILLGEHCIFHSKFRTIYSFKWEKWQVGDEAKKREIYSPRREVNAKEGDEVKKRESLS